MVTVGNCISRAHADTALPKIGHVTEGVILLYYGKLCVTSSKHFSCVNFHGLKAVRAGLYHQSHNGDGKCGSEVLGIEKWL